MMGFKMTEILLIMAVLLLLFGATRLPQLGSSLGAAIKNFKKGFGGEESPEEQAKDRKSAALTGTGSAEPQEASPKVSSKDG